MVVKAFPISQRQTIHLKFPAIFEAAVADPLHRLSSSALQLEILPELCPT
jgi:hypothetical protein